MKRGEIAGKVVSDYKKFFYYKDVEEYRAGITEFIRDNEKLTDEQFFKKFDDEFATANVIHKALSRMYLARISSAVNTIKVITVIYLIASIIAGIAIAVQLTP